MDADWLRRMSIENAKMAMIQSQYTTQLKRDMWDGGSYGGGISHSTHSVVENVIEEKGLTIHNIDKIRGRKLSGGWEITDVKTTNYSYVFVVEQHSHIWNPITFLPTTKSGDSAILTLGRDVTNKGSYLLCRSDNTFLELSKENIKGMDGMIFYLNELLHK